MFPRNFNNDDTTVPLLIRRGSRRLVAANDNGTPSVPVTTTTTTLTTTSAAALDAIGQLSDSVRRAVECPVCMELPCSVSTCCENGHVTCDDCSYRMMQFNQNSITARCPICRSAVRSGDTRQHNMTAQPPPPTTVRKLFEVMSVIRLACSYRRNGCPALMYVSVISEHENVCPYASQVRCMVSMCRWTGPYDDAFRHVSVEHQFSAYDVSDNRFVMPDLTYGLRGSTRRMYLLRNIRDNNRLYWLGVARPTDTATQVTVLKVIDPSAIARSVITSPGMKFRVKTANGGNGRYQYRGRPRPVPWDRAMLVRLTEAIERGVEWNTCEKALNLPEWNITSVYDDHQYNAVITWSAQ